MLCDLPEVEYLDGRARAKVSPKTQHSLVQAALLTIIDGCAQDRGLTGTEWRFRIGRVDDTDTLFVPDVAYISLERLRALPVAEREEPPVAPDIAVEVRSAGDSQNYVRRKIARYLSTGAALVLDVLPATRTIVAHSHDGVRTYSATDKFEHPAVPWLRFDVSVAFAKLDLLTKL